MTYAAVSRLPCCNTWQRFALRSSDSQQLSATPCKHASNTGCCFSTPTNFACLTSWLAHRCGHSPRDRYSSFFRSGIFLSAASYSRSTALLYSSIRGSTCCSPVIFRPGLIFGRCYAVVHPALSLDQRRQSDRQPLRAISSWKVPRLCGSANDNQILVYPLRSVAIGVTIGSVGIRKVVSRTPRIARSTQGIERWRSRGIGARRYDTLVFHHRTPRMQAR